MLGFQGSECFLLISTDWYKYNVSEGNYLATLEGKYIASAHFTLHQNVRFSVKGLYVQVLIFKGSMCTTFFFRVLCVHGIILQGLSYNKAQFLIMKTKII